MFEKLKPYKNRYWYKWGCVGFIFALIGFIGMMFSDCDGFGCITYLPFVGLTLFVIEDGDSPLFFIANFFIYTSVGVLLGLLYEKMKGRKLGKMWYLIIIIAVLVGLYFLI